MERENADMPGTKEFEQADEFLDQIRGGPFLAIVISPEGVRFFQRDDLTKSDLRQMAEALAEMIEGD